jgi:DNA-binding transcriptional LysR family regulator
MRGVPPAGSRPLPGLRTGVEDLRAFVAVARAGAVGRASRALGRTQPTISARIAALERAWGTRLFRRTARGMAPTPEGARLLPQAEAVLAGLADLERDAGLPGTPPAELRVGAGDALGREVVPRALGHLIARQPGLEVRLREGPGPRLLDALRRGEIDVALVLESAVEGAGDGIDLAPWIDSPVDLLAPAGWARGPRAVSIAALARARIVTLQEGSAFRRHLDAAWAAAGVALRPAIEVGNLSLVRRFVAAGLGVAPVPAVAFDPRDRAVRVERRRLGGVPALRYLRAVRSGVPLAEPVRLLLERIKS